MRASFIFHKLFFIATFVAFGLSFSNASFAKEKVYKWRLAASWGPTLSPLIDAPREFAKLVNELSDGQLKITVDPSNVHKAPLNVLEMVKDAQYQMGHSASYYWKGLDIATVPFTTIPFGMTAPEMYSWFYYGGGLELMKEEFKKFNILALPGGNTGLQMGGWFKKEIKTIDDLKGLKMRISGLGGEVMSKLGVTVTLIVPGELYTALDRGTIDALELVGPSMDYTMGFYKIAPYYYTGWHEPSAESQFFINQQAFDKLPKRLQTIVLTAARLVAYDTYFKGYDMNATGFENIMSKTKVKIRSLPQDILDKMKEINQNLLADYSKKSPMFKKTVDSQMRYMKKIRKWTNISDYQYLNNQSK